MDGTILGQGIVTSFYTGVNPNTGSSSVQAGNPIYIAVPSGCDWIKVRNFTQYGTNGNSGAYFNGTGNAYTGYEYFWQYGMANGQALVTYKSNGASTANADIITSGGFTLYDPTGQTSGAQVQLSAPVATTATTNATRPVVSTGNTAGLSVGSVVRLSNTAQADVNGIDMVVSAVTTNTSFELLFANNALATAPGAIGGAGFYRIVNYPSYWYPRRRYVTNVTQATTPTVSTSIPHGLTPGQLIRFEIPTLVPAAGMTQLNGVQATILNVLDDYTFTINVNTTNFTAFAWPTIAQQPSSFPSITPFGENTAAALSINAAQVPSIGGAQIFNTNTGILADSTVNTAFLGVILGSGGNGNALTTPIVGPAGTVTFNSSNVITAVDSLIWIAGKSTYGGQ